MAHFHHHSCGTTALILLECAVIIRIRRMNQEPKYAADEWRNCEYFNGCQSSWSPSMRQRLGEGEGGLRAL